MLVVIESCGKANALNSVGRNVHFLRTGALLSHEQVHYTNQLRKRVAAALAADDSFTDLRQLPNTFRRLVAPRCWHRNFYKSIY